MSMLKKSVAISLLLLLAAPLSADDALPNPDTGGEKFKSVKERTSYALGMDIGQSVANNKLDVDMELLIRGIRDVLGEGKPLLSDDELRDTLIAFQQALQKQAEAERQALAVENKKAGEEFLAKNKTKPGVTTLASGLQYKIDRRGTGRVPEATDTVLAHYRGSLVDGTVFESTFETGQPVKFPVAGVIRGWTEALQRMPVGSKWTLYIPSQMAYSENGQGPIGPNETLIFEIELIDIVQQ